MFIKIDLFKVIFISIVSCYVLAKDDIYVKWIGRFGNNLFQFATVYSVAKVNKFDIVAHENKDLDVFLLPYIKRDFQNYPFKNIFSEFAINGHGMLQPFNKSIYDLPPESCLAGFFQTDKYFIKYRKDLLDLYQFKDKTVYDKALNILDKFGGLSICAHVRLGDYASCLNKDFNKVENKLYQKVDYTFPVMDYDYYIRAIELVFEKLAVAPSQCTLFIVTDEVTSEFFRVIKTKLESAFLDLRIVVAKEDDYVSFAMLSLCDICITSASSFSWWGAWLNKEAKMIISPKYWFNYYLPHKQITLPVDIEMSLGNQYFIESQGYFNC